MEISVTRTELMDTSVTKEGTDGDFCNQGIN
jgi:hypothetical protein